VVGVVVIALFLAACGSSTPTVLPKTHRTAPPVSTVPATTTTTVPPSTTTTTTDPGLLPQTTDEPSNDAPLQAEMRALFQAIIDGSPAEARPLFFPETAYVQMKTGLLSDPSSDYADRLLAFYGLDLGAYHDLLVSEGGGATLAQALVDPADATWIPPGACENLIGYWHLPGVRLVYQVGGVVHSFAVDSLISWRGTWYVVHLGPNPRPANVGTVDQPSLGAGTAGPAGGC